MSFIQEIRNSLENPGVPLAFPVEWMTEFFSGSRTDSGIRVNQMTALQLPVVFACVNIVSNGLASLPLNVVELSTQAKTGRISRKLAYDHDLQDLLNTRPHPEMSAQTWKKVMMCYALLWGNSYSEVLLDGAGRVGALAPRAPWKTAAVRLRRDTVLEGIDGEKTKYDAGTLVYKTTIGLSEEEITLDDSIKEGESRFIAPERMIYIPGLTLDGRVGQDTVWLMRQAFGLALATEKFGAKFFGNGGHPGGILELLGGSQSSIGVSTEQVTKARESFIEATGGENMHRIFVTKGGTKFTPLATPNDSAQYLETRKHQREEISAIFQVPGHMLGEAGGVTRATAEQLGQEFISYTLGPWIPSWEQELKYKLFILRNQVGRNSGRFEPKFDTHALIYPDATSKSNFYQKGKYSGYLNTNMILEYEGLNPIDPEDGGEDFWIPVNMSVVGAAPVAVTPNPLAPKTELTPEEPTPVPGEQKAAPDFSSAIVATLPLFTDGFARYSKRSKPELKDFQTIFEPILTGLRDGVKAIASVDMGVTPPDSMPETDRFLAGYTASLHKRATSEFKVADEVKRATRAVAIEVYKELAVRRVK
jgi:HK97 family phage portal protein